MTDYPLLKTSWDEVVELSANIYRQLKDNKIEIDVLIPVLRGGMPLSLLLTKYLKNVETSCVHITRSLTNDVNASFSNPIFKGITNSDKITNKNVLICEDIIDKGYSLDMVVEKIKTYNPKKIYIATLYNFNKGKYKDVFSGVNMKDYRWILFPWENEL